MLELLVLLKNIELTIELVEKITEFLNKEVDDVELFVGKLKEVLKK